MRAAWAFWPGYGVLAWVFAWERLHYDVPPYVMKMLQTGRFTFEHFRTTGPLFEWAPWMAAKFGANIETLVRLHSLNDWFMAFGAFLVLAYGVRSPTAAGAWTFAMAVGYRYNFAVPVSELYPGLALLMVAAYARRTAWASALWGWTGHILTLPATAGWMVWHALKFGLTPKLFRAGALAVVAGGYHLVVSTGYQAAQSAALFQAAAVEIQALPCPIPPFPKLGLADWVYVAVFGLELAVLGLWGMILWIRGRFSRPEAALFALAAAGAFVFLARPRTLMAWGFDMSERYVFVFVLWAVWALYFHAPRAKIWTLVALTSLAQLFFFMQKHRDIRFRRLELLCQTMNGFPEQKFLIRESNWVTEKIGTDVGLSAETALFSMAKYGTVKQAVSEEAMVLAGVKFSEAGEYGKYFDFRPDGAVRNLNTDGENAWESVKSLRIEGDGERVVVYNPGVDSVFSGLCATPVKIGYERGSRPVPLTTDLPPGAKCTLRLRPGEGKIGIWWENRFFAAQ